ncbi:MAG: cbb3-type cytochrome c oxidase subunit I [Candidatus Sumerlaeaceae bacterium]|nr:cbb3-type cytochrome c oxidase subunit I [Candidatus Sumerlaeaceae bacterium]
METTMETNAAMPAESPLYNKRNYLNNGYSLRSWFLTVDHKRIALIYLASITFFFILGGFFAMLVRLELLTPKGDFMTSDGYNRAFTMHGIMMIFFFLIPSIPAVLGNFLVPLQIGAKDLAFPKINLLSWYMYIGGGALALFAMINGGIDTTWRFYTPYSTGHASGYVVTTILGLFLMGFSSIFTGLNFIVTIHKMRAPGLTWFRLPLFIWAMYATSLIQILGTPVVAITLSLAAVEKGLKIGIFDPAYGGDPILFQHLFWFYSHPAVYIMILPAMGIISEVISCFSRKVVFGYSFVAISSMMIAVIGFFVWGHHMFLTGQSQFAGLIFAALSFLVAIPSAVKTFNWTATLYKGSISFEAPMLYVFGFLGVFLIGGLTGLFFPALGLDRHLHDTYFVVAHFHYIMVGGAIMGYMAGLHFWWPKMFGKKYPEGLAQAGAVATFIGFNLTFFPQFILGYMGMPRHYHEYVPEFQFLHILSTAGASVLAIGYLIPAICFGWSLLFGEPTGPNPWNAKGLEWEKSLSPPPTENFSEIPVVTEEAYNYPDAEATVVTRS